MQRRWKQSKRTLGSLWPLYTNQVIQNNLEMYLNWQNKLHKAERRDIKKGRKGRDMVWERNRLWPLWWGGSCSHRGGLAHSGGHAGKTNPHSNWLKSKRDQIL